MSSGQAFFIKSPQWMTALVKLCEECSELGQASAKTQLFGIEEFNPDTGKTNRQSLEEEAADVYAILTIVETKYRLDRDAIKKRVEAKIDKHVDMGLLDIDEMLV